MLKDKLKGKLLNLLLCNILAPVIEQLAPGFDDLISDEGKAILSGVLIDQVPGLKKSLKSLGWTVSFYSSLEQWALLEIKRQKSSSSIA